jgi:hypothetical protein
MGAAGHFYSQWTSRSRDLDSSQTFSLVLAFRPSSYIVSSLTTPTYELNEIANKHFRDRRTASSYPVLANANNEVVIWSQDTTFLLIDNMTRSDIVTQLFHPRMLDRVFGTCTTK